MGLILPQEVEVILNNSRQVVHFRNLGYECHKGDKLTVSVDELPKSTNVVNVHVTCDNCGCDLYPSYGNYNLVMGLRGRYLCTHCSRILNWIDKSEEDFKIINQKRVETNLKTLGCEYPTQSPIVQAKIVNKAYEKGLVRISSQQLYLHELYGGELNGVVSRYNCDIVLRQERIAIEYDGRGHDMRVRLGAMTQEEFNIKEIVRDKTIKSEGWKQIHLISRQDYLPSDNTLLEILEISKEYFNTTEHTWINWDIDKGKYYNAEHREGVLFNFGELRRLPRSA